MKEHSAGGVVIEDGKILLLKKYFGDWVLPKGKMEKGETTSITALREVFEESGIKGEVIKRIGYARYVYMNQTDAKVSKRVDYYLMKKTGGSLIPQKEEGFQAAEFVEFDKAINLLKHSSERNMVKNAIKIYQNNIKRWG